MRFIVKMKIVLLLVCICPAVAASGYETDSNDFAVEVVEYIEGTGVGTGYNDANTALGRSSIDAPWWQVTGPALPAYSAWGIDQVVTIGVGGSLILKFNHKIGDDENNPYGYDFIVFGNQMQAVEGNSDWDYSKDPCEFVFNSGEVDSEYGKISVSQDGNDWYCFDDGPYADSFAPTLGRVYDTANPNDSYTGWENLWWGEVTNPTLPLDPNLEPNDFAGNTVTYICQAYGESAGGTAFDLEWLAAEDYDALEVDLQTGRKWIQYVKIEQEGVERPEIDAVSDVSACGDYKHLYPVGDLDTNCRVSYEDIMLFCSYWAEDVNGPNVPAAQADLYEDGVVNFHDWALMANSWFACSWECQ